MPMNNQERAMHAKTGLEAYSYSKEMRNDYEEPEYMIADMICDLLHLADQNGIDAKHVYDIGWLHFDAEKHDPIENPHLFQKNDAI